MANHISAALERLNTLTDNLIDSMKMKSPNFSINCHMHSLQDLIQKSTTTYADVAKKKHLDFTIDHDPAIHTIYLDPLRIGQVLDNLLSNALKFTKKGSIHIITRHLADDNQVCVTVANTKSSGIPENMSKMFEKFYQGTNTKDTAIKGFGLGLSICKDIIQHHKGNIWASTSNDTIYVHFTLPLAPPDMPS